MVVPEPLRHQHLDGLTEHLVALVAEHLLRLRIDHLDVAHLVDHHHGVGRRFDDLAEALFQALARGDVDDCREHHGALLGLDRIQADLDRELAAVLLQSIQIAACAHGARHWSRVIGGAQARMPRAESLRNQHVDRLAEQFLALVAEHPFGLRVHHLDEAFTVDHHHRVRCGLDDLPEPGLALFQRGINGRNFGALECADVVQGRSSFGQGQEGGGRWGKYRSARCRDAAMGPTRCNNPRLAGQRLKSDAAIAGRYARPMAACGTTRPTDCGSVRS